MIWSQVTGCVMSRPSPATDLRYQSSWVLAQNGTATSPPCQVDASIELGNVLAGSRLDGRRHRRQEARLGELGHVGRVDAHDVDRRVVGRQAAHQLLALLGGLAGQGDVSIV